MNRDFSLISGFCKLFLGLMIVGSLFLVVRNAGGLTAFVSQVEQQAQEERFFIPDVNTGIGSLIVDRDTGVCYYWRKAGYGAGLTVLVDPSGDPMIWEGSYGQEENS